MMVTAEELQAWDKAYFWHPFTQMQVYEREENLIFARGEGNYLYDLDGKKYFDGISSLWCNVHGHNHPRLNAALKAQVDKIAHSTTLGASNPPAIMLARKLVEIAPEGLTKVFYSEDGAEAMEIAVKLASHYWRNLGRPEKNTFVTLSSAYHGDTVGTVSVGGIQLFHETYGALLFSPRHLASPFSFALEQFGSEGWQREEAGRAWLQCLEEDLRTHGESTAALVMESGVQGAAGILPFPPGILAGAKALCEKYEVLLILDEVATGLGRTGTMFYCQQESVTPDLMAVGKGLSGGYLPLAATLTSQQVYDAFLGEFGECKQFYHGHTYTGNPLACAVALENLSIFEDENTLDNVAVRIAQIARCLQDLEQHPHVGLCKQRGLLIGVQLLKDKSANVAFDYGNRVEYAVSRAAWQRGLFTRPLGDTLVLVPPLSSTEEEMATMFATVRAAIDEVVAAL